MTISIDENQIDSALSECLHTYRSHSGGYVVCADCGEVLATDYVIENKYNKNESLIKPQILINNGYFRKCKYLLQRYNWEEKNRHKYHILRTKNLISLICHHYDLPHLIDSCWKYCDIAYAQKTKKYIGRCLAITIFYLVCRKNRIYLGVDDICRNMGISEPFVFEYIGYMMQIIPQKYDYINASEYHIELLVNGLNLGKKFELRVKSIFHKNRIKTQIKPKNMAVCCAVLGYYSSYEYYPHPLPLKKFIRFFGSKWDTLKWGFFTLCGKAVSQDDLTNLWRRKL